MADSEEVAGIDDPSAWTAPSGVPTGGAGVAIRVRDVAHAYARGAVPVLHGLDLDVDAGGYVALTGPSGAGKSTLLSLLGGLEPLQRGEARVGDRDLARLSGDDLADFRRSTIGFVFQHYGLVDVLTARENVELSLALARVPRDERRRRALELLAGVELGHRADHRAWELSGGERQRVAIARALANRPRLLLADEPTGNLDETVAAHVLDVLEAVRGETGCTLVVVTHNRAVAARAEWTRRLVAGRWDGG